MLSAEEMHARYDDKDQEYLDNVGAVRNMGVNGLADVPHGCWLNEVR